MRELTRIVLPASEEDRKTLDGYDPERLAALQSRRLSIVANNCWGGLASHRLGMESHSPFKGLYIPERDYLRLLSRFDHYLWEAEPRFYEWHPNGFEGQERFPVLLLDDVRLFCNHAEDPAPEIENWKRRRDKVNPESLFFMFSTGYRRYAEDFCRMELPGDRVCFVPFASQDPHCLTVTEQPDERWLDTVMEDVFPGKPNRHYRLFDLLEGKLPALCGKQEDRTAKEAVTVKKTSPAVSVVIPVYNVEKWLPACLDSVLSQTLQDLEVIGIDDCSPDGSGKILDEYAAKDPRVRVFHLPENHMQGYGRNLGLREARGEYVYFLDSDDLITPNAMEELTALCTEENLDGVYFDSQALFESEELRARHGAYPGRRMGDYPENALTGLELLDLFTSQNEWLVYVQRQFWRRSFLLEHEVWNIEHLEHEDEFFSFQAAVCARRVRYIPKDYFIRRFRTDSVMTRKAMPKDFHGYFVTFIRMSEMCERRGLKTEGVKDCLAHMYDCMNNFFDDFRSEDPAEWFDAPTAALYRFFAAEREASKISLEKMRNVWKPLQSCRSVWIYGAGRIGRSTCRRLFDAGIATEGFLVSARDGNPETLFERPVRVFAEEREALAGKTVVVAMAKALHPEIRQMLEKEKGLTYYLYAQNVLEGPFVSEG